MQAYDYVWKVYGEQSTWNTFDYRDDTQEILTLVSASPDRLVLDIQEGADRTQAELTGSFSFEQILASVGLQDIEGMVDTLTVRDGQLLMHEERYPAGTSLSDLLAGGYAFEMSLIDGNDYFAGSPLAHSESNDGIRGGDGNDTFIGYGAAPGWDQFYGEAGTDTAIFRGEIGEYTIEWSDAIWDSRLRDGTNVSGYVVTDKVDARDDATALVEVERLQFSDVTLALDIEEVAGQAYRIYKTAFDREPDIEGLGFWVKRMDAGLGLDAVAEQFISSPEFVRMYGANPSNEQFVDLLYANVLDRESDQSGYDFWIEAFGRGLTREGLLAEFSESPENVANVAPLIADGIRYTEFMG